MFCDVHRGAPSLTGLCRLIELQGAEFGFVVLTQHQLLFYLQRMKEKGEKNGSQIAPQTSCTAFKVTVQLSNFLDFIFAPLLSSYRLNRKKVDAHQNKYFEDTTERNDSGFHQVTT